jgi:hypothetical protein
LRAALAALDIDAAQWRALTRVLLKNDYDLVLSGTAGSKRAAVASLFTGVIYLLSGTLPAYVVRISPDIMLGATMMTTFVAFMVTSSLLLGEGVSIASPDDYGVLGFRPVSSRTYLAARVTTLMVRTLGIAALVGGPSVLAFAFKGGVALALAAAFAAVATATASTFGIVALYGWMLRLVGPRRLVRIMSYAQFAANAVVWVGFFIASQGMQKRMLGSLHLDSALLILAYPGCWFASWVDLASGTVDGVRIAAALLSVGLAVALVLSIGGRLSLDYNERLAALATAGESRRTPKKRRRTSGRTMLGAETRVVAILLRSHFREDMRFRLGMISFLPLGLLYLVMGLSGEAVADPFVAGDGGPNGTFFVQFILLFLPFNLRNMMTFSQSHEAAWIFHSTPVDKGRLVTATRNIVAIGFLLPFVVLIGAVFGWFIGNPWHALLHAIFLGLIGYLTLAATVLADPRLPFSHKPEPRAGVMFGTMFGAAFGGIGAYFLIVLVVYRSPVAIAVTLLGLIAASVIIEPLILRRARRRLAESG